MADTDANSLTHALLKLESELTEFGNLYKSLDEAKAAVHGATEDLKRRADDQWGLTQMQLSTLQQALISIQEVASESKSLTGSLVKVATEISNVDFPSRLNSIGVALDELSVVSQESRDKLIVSNIEVRECFESLRKDLAPIATDIPAEVAANGRQIVELQGSISVSSAKLLKTLEGVYRTLGGKLDQLEGRVDATNQSIGVQASAISTLQAATVRDLESIRKEVIQCAGAVQQGTVSNVLSYERLKKQILYIQLVLFANIGLAGLLVWKSVFQ
jgi:chromosome segregation ATPase